MPGQETENSDHSALRRYVNDSSCVRISYPLLEAFCRQATKAGLRSDQKEETPLDSQMAGVFVILMSHLRGMAGAEIVCDRSQIDHLAARVSSFPSDGQPASQVPNKELRFRRMIQECWDQAIEISGASKLPPLRGRAKPDGSRGTPG